MQGIIILHQINPASMEGFSTVAWSGAESPNTDQSMNGVQHLSQTAALELVPVLCIGIGGITGNGLVLFVLLTNKEFCSRLRNWLIINQCVVDLLSSVSLITTYVSLAFPKSYEGSRIWFCWLIDSEIPLWCLSTVSTSNLMSITLERYFMVIHPIIYHRYCSRRLLNIVIVSTWIFTTVLVISFAFPFSGVQNGVCYLQGFFPTEVLAWFCSIAYYLLYFFLPIGMFIFCYTHMAITLRKRNKIGPMIASNKKKISKQQMSLTKMMSAVSIAFIVCWAPLNTHYLLMFTGVAPDLSMTDRLYRSLVYLTLVNSGINPILYAFNYDDFRCGLRSLVLKSCWH